MCSAAHQMKMGKSFSIWVAIVLMTPVGFFLCCFANPMLLMFLQRIDISNQSTEELRVIPMGRWASDRPGRAPLVWTRFLGIPRGPAEFRVGAGEDTSFAYDWDDLNLCWLLVRNASSAWKVMPSSLAGRSCELTPTTDGGCCRAIGDDFTFKPETLAGLADAPAWLVKAACPDGGPC